jgi:hypothetical protein
MTIAVTCPSCLKRFSVSDKFAGKSGPCPSCQKTIKIPEKAEEVVIHAPEDAAPKDSKGRSILKPIRRTEVNLSLPVILAASLTTVVIFGLALGFGLSGGAPAALLGIAAVVLAVPLVFIGYWFLHDDELDSFRGKELLVRCGICGLLFAAAWAIYVYIPNYLNDGDAITGIQIAMLIPIMIAIGTAASVLTLELEIVQGGLHYALYLGITFILAWLAGAPLTGPGDNSLVPARGTPPAISQPAPSTPASPAAEPEKKIPSVLQ